MKIEDVGVGLGLGLGCEAVRITEVILIIYGTMVVETGETRRARHMHTRR